MLESQVLGWKIHLQRMTFESENTKNWGLTHFNREHRDLSESGKLEEAYLWGGKPVQRGR